MVNKALSSLLVIAGLLFLVACQPGKAPETGDGVVPVPSLTRTVEQSHDEQFDDKEQEEAGSSQSLPVTPQPTESHQPVAVSATHSPVQGGKVVVGGLGAPDTFNPLLAESEVERALVPLLFDSLLAFDRETAEPIPHLAEMWNVAEDDQIITFTLRSDARWQDGQPVIADDVVFTIEAARDPAIDSIYGPQLADVTQISAPDDRTVVVSLREANCPSLIALGRLPILPQHLLTRADVSTLSPGAKLIGSGPFIFSDWPPDGEVRLARNPEYWGESPYLDSWSYRPFKDIVDLGHALESGEIDVGLMPPGRLPDFAAASSSLSVFRYPVPEYLFVAFANDHPILSEQKVRLALSMAVDRDQLLERVLDGAGELVVGPFPSSHWASDPTLRPPLYDPDGARQLLAEAGWTDSDGDGWLDRDGDRLRLPVRTNGGDQLRADVAMLIAGYYRDIGIDASVQLVRWGGLVDDLFTHDFDVIVFGWPIGADPDQSQWWLSTENEIGFGYNFVSFADERVDGWLQEALAAPNCDLARRAELYRQVQDVLAQERPYDFLFVPYATVLSRSDLYGVIAGPFAGPLDSAPRWYDAP